MFTAVELVLRQHASFRSQTSVGRKISSFVGPPPTLSLHQACAMGSLKLLDLLWEASCTSKDKRSAGWSLSNFLRSEPHYYHWEFMVSVLVAANRGDLEMMQWLFGHFSGCEAPADAFEAAAVNGHLPVVKFLLANSDNCRDELNDSAKKRKIGTGGDGKAISQSVPAQGNDGTNVVHWRDSAVTEAASKGHLELVRWLYDNVAHKISQDCTDRVIEQVLRFGDIELAKALAPPGMNVLVYASEEAAPQVVERMLDGGFLEKNGKLAAETMSRLADKGHFALLERLFALCSSPTEYMDRWCFAFGNALSKACKSGQLLHLKMLLQHPLGRRVSNLDVYTENLLVVAADAGQREVVEHLVKEGFSDERGEALLRAVGEGHLTLVEWLLKNVPYPGAVEDSYLMDEAAENGHVDMLQFFQTLSSSQVHEANRPRSDESEVRAWWRQTRHAMDLAAKGGHLPVLEWLSANRNEACTTKAMDEAARSGHLEVIKWLHLNRSEGCTTAAMDSAAARGDLEIVQWLHANRREGCTTDAMEWAAYTGQFHVVKWLHENRSEGCTDKAIQNALWMEHLDIAAFLTQRYPGRTPDINLGWQMNHFDIVLFVQKYYSYGIDALSIFQQAQMTKFFSPQKKHVLEWLMETRGL